MSSSEIKLTITPYTTSTLPLEHALVAASKTFFATLDSWKKGKTFSNSKGQVPYSVRTLSRTKGPDDGAAWHARISDHQDGSFDDFWDGLGRDKALKEQEYIPELVKAILLRSVSPTQMLWTLHYKFPWPVSPRVFTVLQVTHLTGGEDGTPREGWVITVPVDVTGDTQLKGKEPKGVRGRYVSIERITEGKDGGVEWAMATSSTPGGRIPQVFAERAIPGKISKDVPLFLEWMSKNKVAPVPTSPLTTRSPSKAPQAPPAETQPVTTKEPATDSKKPSAPPDSTS